MNNEMFAPFLAWLASETGEDVRAGEVLDLRFEPPKLLPTDKEMDNAPAGNIKTRVCCSFGASGIFGKTIDISDLKWHKYLRAESIDKTTANGEEGGVHGYIYTRRGGFIDIGHVRDFMDYTRRFANECRSISPRNTMLFVDRGKIYLTTKGRMDLSSYLTALLGAKLAYDYATWHEISSYFPPSIGISEKFSSFSPEDNFSNALGIYVGFNALLSTRMVGDPEKNVTFDMAAEKALLSAISQLGPVSSSVTNEAREYIEGHWWDKEFFSPLRSPVIRRNFDAFPPVSPWLITDIDVPGKRSAGEALRAKLGRPKPARIHTPMQYMNQSLDSLAYLEIREAVPQVHEMMPLLHALRASDFPNIIDNIRQEERKVNPNKLEADSPGPPVP